MESIINKDSPGMMVVATNAHVRMLWEENTGVLKGMYNELLMTIS